MRRVCEFFLWIGLILAPQVGFASVESLDYSLGQLAAAYHSVGGPARALEQLRCFVRKHGFQKFRTKPAGDMAERCNARATVTLESERAAAIVDFTVSSSRPRLFIFDFAAQKVKALHVAHGRYGNTPRSNTQFSMDPKRNSILKGLHFSNAPGLNASAGGFYLTGQEYEGVYGRSLVLHGLEGEINDNACLRATVIHPSSKITDSSTDLMSSGCPMVARSKINFVVDLLRNGSFYYIFTPAEAALSGDTCGRNLLL